jgi:hypothetical protein
MKYFIFILFPFLMTSQSAELIESDFNQDGSLDTLESYYDGGSGFGGTYVTLTDGRTQTKFELNSFGCFCDIKKVILIPQELYLPKNKPFLETIKTKLLPKKETEADPSLQWLISAHSNHSYLTDHPFFDLVIKSPPDWITGDIQIPETYSIEIDGEKIQALYTQETEYSDDIEYSSDKAWLIYYGHNHNSNSKENFVLAADSDYFKVYKTSHGLIIKKDDTYSWVFVSDHSLTGSPDRLRWESIGEVEIVGKYIIFRMVNSRDFSNPIFIINSESGKTARLNTVDYIGEPFYIENNKINITTYSGTNTYEIENLLNEFENYNGSNTK